ncbi:MAG: AAA family ATPase [Acidobacteria bacterium]|nr:AAA family ATPase [Acidobacteriota bacterium]
MQVIVIGRPDSRLEGLLRQSGRSVVQVPDGDVARRRAAKGDVVLIDARSQPHLPSFVGPLTRAVPDVGFVLLSSVLDPILMLEAMRAGIRECVVEPLSEAELEAAVARVASEHVKEGMVFAFVGAKGGVGTTTTAVNVAMELSRVAPNQTLLVDLHMSNSDAGIFLGEEPRFSVADALENVDRLDDTFFRSLVVRTRAHLDLLGSPDAGPAPAGDPDRIRALIRFACRQYRYTVLDVPRSEPAVLESLDATDRIVIVANQELATVRNASRLAASFRQRYGKERVAVAVTRYDARAGIGQSDIERAVGTKVRYVVPSDYRRAVEALNSGRPVSLGNHTNLAAAFKALARDLAGLPPEADTGRTGGGLFGLFGRGN